MSRPVKQAEITNESITYLTSWGQVCYFPFLMLSISFSSCSFFFFFLVKILAYSMRQSSHVSSSYFLRSTFFPANNNKILIRSLRVASAGPLLSKPEAQVPVAQQLLEPIAQCRNSNNNNSSSSKAAGMQRRVYGLAA
jgi:hypothetical protein